MTVKDFDKLTDIDKLKETFVNFVNASKSLETSYSELKQKVQYLTQELERKNLELEAALGTAEEAKDYLSGILESLNEGIVVLDADDKVTMINRAAEELSGIASKDAIGRDLMSMSIAFEGDGANLSLDSGGRRKNIILSRSDVRDSDKGLRGRVLMLQDVTRIMELESERERNERLIAMGEMAAKIVHEVRSPLCSIELYASMLAKDLEGTGHIVMANGISTGIKSLNNVLTNMLFFARPQKPRLARCSLGKILDDCLYMLRPMMDSRGIDLQCGQYQGADAYCDGELIKQVVLNIIMNAIQAVEECGKIVAGVSVEDGFASLSVTDYGQGIDQQSMQRIFDPFFSTKDKGTGLGLAIAQKIMQAHGGGIKVKSSKSDGTCFKISLPLAGTEIYGGAV